MADAVADAEVFGAAEIVAGDQEQILEQKDGQLWMTVDPDKLHKDHAKDECGHDSVTWNIWADATALPTEAGHYYLMTDVTLGAVAGVAYNNGAEVTICLNGYKLSRAGQLFTISGKLTICDCVGTGACESSYGSNGGTLRLARGGTLNVYGGTYTNLKEVTTGGAVVVVSRDVYSGTGGTADTTENKSTFNFYGGKISGGKTTGTGGNLTVFHAECTFNMYGGIIENGTSTGNGGNIRSYGTTNLLGGTITGGSAAKNGDDVYMHGGTLTIGGNMNIGSIYLNGKSFKIHSSGLTTETPIEIIGTGTFATNVLTDLTECFKSTGEIVYDEEAKTLTIQ